MGRDPLRRLGRRTWKALRLGRRRWRLAYKAEHVVDPETGVLVAVSVEPAERGDTASVRETLGKAGLAVTELWRARRRGGPRRSDADWRRCR